MRIFFFDLASNVKELQIEVPYFDIFLNVSRRKQFKSGIFLEVWGYFERKLFTFLDTKKNNIVQWPSGNFKGHLDIENKTCEGQVSLF